MSTSVTLKLSIKLRMRIARAAKRRGQTAERWILEAIYHEVERRERFLAYVRQARRAHPSDSDVSSQTRSNSWLEGFSSAARSSRASSRRVL
jgi:predicted DNA-binding protein